LLEENDVIVLEGAGSPAETKRTGASAIFAIPIFAISRLFKLISAGLPAPSRTTIHLLEPEERARIKGIIINKFRGDIALLEPGLKMIEDLTRSKNTALINIRY
jgi:adenosylcobyric acid synthase